MTQLLSYHQKRQAARLYYFSRLDYLKGLKERVDALVESIDPAIERAQRLGVDRILTNERWGVRDTVANWTTGAWPYLKSFQQGVVKDIAGRAYERYSGSGASECWMALNEFSMMWATAEQEAEFKQRFDAVYQYALEIDAVVRRPCSHTQESQYANAWLSIGHSTIRLPRFVVREDIVGRSGAVPSKTGVYVAQNDPFSVCQFAWTGTWMKERKEGYLDDANLLNELGRDAARAVGHKYLWAEDVRLVEYLKKSKYASDYSKYVSERKTRRLEASVDDPIEAVIYVSEFGTESKPVDWYYVELVEGEYDDDPDGDPSVAALADEVGNRVADNQPCPRSGWWVSPAKATSRRYFEQGALMPSLGSDYGLTIWQWDVDQSAPRL